MLKEIKKFYEKTKFKFSQDDLQVPLSEWPLSWRRVFYKTYERFQSIKLKKLPKGATRSPLEKLLSRRRTTREFSDQELNYDLVSRLLNYSLGISRNQNNPETAKRTYPSAGARYPIEAYIIINRVSGLDQGLYHYNVKDNVIEAMVKQDLTKEAKEIINNEMGYAPLLLILTGVLGRTEVKYGVNAYRFALIEAGHVGQNVSLLCQEYSLGSCAIGGFDNDRIAKLLDLTFEEIPLYLIAIGKKNDNQTPKNS